MRITAFISLLAMTIVGLSSSLVFAKTDNITKNTLLHPVLSQYANHAHFLHLTAPIDTGKYVVVIMEDGNEYRGQLIEQTEEKIVLESVELGRLELLMPLVKRVRTIKEGSLYARYAPIDTRYFFGTNGFSAKKKSGYYQNTWVLFNQFNYGITDNLSVGGGVVPIFLFGFPEATPLWGTVKYAIPMPYEHFHLGVGSLFGTIGFQEEAGFGLLFAQATFGTKEKNINFGAGYGYVAGELSKRPTFSFSALWRVNRKTALISENYLINDGFQNYGILSAGVRFYGKRISIDAALARVLPSDGFWAAPWLAISVPFGDY